MNRIDFHRLVNDTFQQMQDLLVNKGADYSPGEDVLENFKRNAVNLGLDPLEIWAVYTFKHIDAISTYVKNQELKSEPIEGRILDVMNYMVLLRALIVDRTSLTEQDTDSDYYDNYSRSVVFDSATEAYYFKDGSYVTVEELADAKNLVGDSRRKNGSD